MKTKKIQWVEENKHLSDLRPYEDNPRHISETQYEKLKQSLEQDGYHSRIKATRDGRVVGGHQRLKAMRELGWANVQVLVPDRDLTDKEFQRIMIRDNVNNGSWDMDALANGFDLEDLRAWGVNDVMNIAPFDEEDESHEPGKSDVRCPNCETIFSVKGNKA